MTIKIERPDHPLRTCNECGTGIGVKKISVDPTYRKGIAAQYIGDFCAPCIELMGREVMEAGIMFQTPEVTGAS